VSLSLCLTDSHTHSHPASPYSSAVLRSPCLFSFHETPVKLRDPLAVPAIRGAYSGRPITNHEEIDFQREETDRKVKRKSESSGSTPVVWRADNWACVRMRDICLPVHHAELVDIYITVLCHLFCLIKVIQRLFLCSDLVQISFLQLNFIMRSIAKLPGVHVNIKWMEIVKKRRENEDHTATAEPISLVSLSYWALSPLSPSVCNKGSCQPIRPLLKYEWRDERDEGL